ncbi:MAG: N-acetylneuraminate lyase [Ruminococcaceae bacterium]|nr:N-acetylneuraminate lyase [Oscillospiraceae bacterium]
MAIDTKKFGGIFTALLTPFDSNNKINAKELEKLVKFNLDMGVKGFYVCGSTGEAFLLSTDERKYVMEIVKDCAPEATLIAHIGSVNEADATELGKHAKRLSYDLVSSVAPYYYNFSFNEIKNYYYRLADASELQMLVYHIPAFSGVKMGIKEMSEFLSDDRFAGIKYTSNDFFTMEQCKTAFPDKIIYNGYDEMCLAGLSMGADGAIGSTYNFMADKFVKIYNLMQNGEIEAAKAIQKEANKLITVLIKNGVMQSEKEVLNQLGFDFGICRKPFGELTEEQKDMIKKEIIPYTSKIN